MIDKEHQGKGFAYDAMKLTALEIVKRGGKRIRTMHKPENIAASKLYAKLGFCVIGTLDDGDTLLEYIPHPGSKDALAGLTMWRTRSGEVRAF